MLTLKKFTKMRDDAMMMRISVKTTRMYANSLIHQVLKQPECILTAFIHQKTIVLTVAFKFIFILTFESLFSIFIFSEKSQLKSAFVFFQIYGDRLKWLNW